MSRIYNIYSTLLRGIWINIAPKVGKFPEAKGRGKYSLGMPFIYQQEMLKRSSTSM